MSSLWLCLCRLYLSFCLLVERCWESGPVLTGFDRWAIFPVSIHHYDNVFSILKLCWTQTSPSQLSAQERHKTNMFVSILVFILQIYPTFLFLYLEIILLLNWDNIIIHLSFNWVITGSLFWFPNLWDFVKLRRDNISSILFPRPVGDKKPFPTHWAVFQIWQKKNFNQSSLDFVLEFLVENSSYLYL